MERIGLEGQGKSLFFFMLFFILSILVYFPALDNYFVEDTLTGFSLSWDSVLSELTSTGVVVGYRPGVIGFFVLNKFLWGREPLALNLISVLLHALTCQLIFVISRKVTGKVVVAFTAALLFLFAPVHVEAIVLTSASFCTITSTLIGLFGCWIWIKQPDLPSPTFKIFSAVIYLFALLFKESIIVLPGFLLLLDFGMKRIPINVGIQKTLKYFLGYWPFVVSLAIYSLIYISLGLYSDSMSYANYSTFTAPVLFDVWNNYARAMFMPFSSFIEWRVGTLGFLWFVLVLVFMHLDKKSLWAFLWIFLGFLTMYSKFHDRSAYLPMVGFVIAFAIMGEDVFVWIKNQIKIKVLANVLKSILLVVMLFYIVASYRAIQRTLESWEVASKLTWKIPRKARQLVPNPPKNAEMIFIGVPELYGKAHVYGWGLVDETRYVFDMPDLIVKQVVDAYHGHWRIRLSDISCESENPRFFFKFNPISFEIEQVEIGDLGLDCPNKSN